MSDVKITNPTPDEPEKKIKKGWSELWTGSVEFFKKLIDLRVGLDREGTIVSIKNNKRMQGANAWLLMCSIMIASLGLDLNSPAVIIGAMLISPLMSPILGVGLAIGINDESTLFISLKHFGIAIAIALVTSTLYFFFTPLGNETNEIIARTSPNLLDVAVAFFGGIAGIISGSRKDKSNAIPGVAIATALMPPLCVTGYGIANGNWSFMFNSFYLFFMNATFVSLATFIIVRFLDFPMRKHMNETAAKKTRLYVIVISILMIVPALIIFSSVIQKSNQERTILKFIDEKFPNAMYNFERIENTDSVEIILSVPQFLTPEKITAYKDSLSQLNVENFNLIFLQDAKARKEFEELKARSGGAVEIAENSLKQQAVLEKEIRILNYQIDSLVSDTLLFRKMANEVKVLFPDLEEMSFANQANNANFGDGKQSSIPVLVLDWKKVKTNSAKKRRAIEEDRLVRFIKERTSIDTLKVTH